jgi:thiol-disulfide isomerase/thioredoxin
MITLVLLCGFVSSGCWFLAEETTKQAPQKNFSRSVSTIKFFDRVSSNNYATNFAWWDSTGTVHELRENYGKVILLNFWSTWCKPCVAERSVFDRLRAKYGDSLAVIGITLKESLNGANAVLPVQSFIDSIGIPYQQIVGTSELSYSYGGIDILPTTIVISPELKLVATLQGEQTAESLEKAIRKAFTGK